MPAPRPHHRRPVPRHTGQNSTPATTGIELPEPGPLLYTPEEAADLLRVRASWLRKKAAARAVPCTFLGKHLRFSPADLTAIVTTSARPATGRRTRRRTPPTPDRDLIDRPDPSVHAPVPNDHDQRDGSTQWPG
jgi:excisionase family DNA binding protein